MKKKLIFLSGFVLFLLLAIIGYQQYTLYQTKQHSPEDLVEFINGDVSIQVFYNRPSKKGRVIFGELVPYDQWWRTGANEATTIKISRDIIFNEADLLKAGHYSVVTIPHKNSWTLIFNSNLPDWGTEYKPEMNVLETTMQVESLPQTVEQFLIDFTENTEGAKLIMAWDTVKTSVPFRVF